MNAVPLLFLESVVPLLPYESFCFLKALDSNLFRNGNLWTTRLYIDVNVVFNSEVGTFDYCLTRRQYITNNAYCQEPYTYDPADRRFISNFELCLHYDKRLIDTIWTTATPSDPTFLKLLRAPFARTSLDLDMNYPEFLKLLPGYCTFNTISSCSYNDAVKAIIERSQECGRLENVSCMDFFKKRGREASIQWILTNKRLQRISCCDIRDHEDLDSIGAALTYIGVN